MKPPPFEYVAAHSLEEALDALATHGWDAKLLAGGQSLIPVLNFRLASPAVLIDLNPVRELAFVEANGVLRIGAMTRQRTLERHEHIARHAPLITAAMPFVAHPQIRTRGTIGGSLAHCDPAAELPAVCLALDATLVARSQRGERTIPARDFFFGLFMTALEPDEILTEIRIPPMTPDTRYAFREVARRHGDFALAGVALTLRLDAEGRIQSPRVALFGVHDAAVLAESAMRLLDGATPSEELLREAAHAVANDIEPSSDMHASAEYRTHLAQVLTARALHDALAQTTE
ncbi:MAG: xanthine dehydrogenase family protein subunit M [Ardenticatenia bacterium]|nr:MAG: xanthine dehydrogenase family protein subunit M [Ardenticatenia bacterium]